MNNCPHTTSGCLDPGPAPVSAFDTIIEKLLIALLIFMPFALGARKAWSNEVVIILAGAIVICFLLKLICDRRCCFIWTWAYVPLAVLLLLAIAQIIPLPVSLVNAVSSSTVTLKTELLGDLVNSGKTDLGSMTLSFYPNATRHDLRLILSIAAVFVVVLNIFRTPSQIRRFLTAIALIGGCVALFALIQDFFGNGKIYWYIYSPHKSFSGPFANHSHFGQFMNLSIGAAIGCLCIKLHEDFLGKRVTPSAVTDYFGSASARALWLLVSMIVLGVVTIFISMTRGGMVSMFVAFAFITLLLTARQSFRTHSWIMIVAALAAFTCILYIGFDAVYDRLATLSIVDNYRVRMQIIDDLTASYRQFPVIGTGLGTHSVIYPMFQTIDTTALFTHAENEYAQLMEETGFVGLISMVVFGLFVCSGFIKNIRKFESSASPAAYGLGFGLLAILIHSLSDFGQHVPANAFLSAIFCALLLGLARAGSKPDSDMQPTGSTGFVPLRIFALVVVLGFFGWSLSGANSARIAESHWNRALVLEKPFVENNWQGTDAEYAELISHAAAASDAEPGNIRYRYWLNVYRWSQVSQATDPDFGILPDELMPAVFNIVDQFHKARTYCPTYGPTYSTLGQIEKNVLDNWQGGSERIKLGLRLAPNDPVVCLAAGSLDIEEGNIDLSFKKFDKAVKLNGSLFKGLADMYAVEVDRPDLAIDLAGDNAGRLNYVVKILDETDDHKELIEQIKIKQMDLLKEKCSQPDASASDFIYLANIYRKQNDYAPAIEYYQRALVLNYGQVDWRYRLARLLADAGRIPEAMNEAKICLRLRPQSKAAKKLIEELSLHPKMLEQ